MSGAQSNMISVLIRRGNLDMERERDQGYPSRGGTLWGYSKKTVICKPRWEASVPWSWTFNCHKYEKTGFCCSCHSVCGIWLQQPCNWARPCGAFLGTDTPTMSPHPYLSKSFSFLGLRQVPRNRFNQRSKKRQPQRKMVKQDKIIIVQP